MKLLELAKQIQQEYRDDREQSNYSIIDIERQLRENAENGVIWVLKGMGDVCDAEKVLIDHYLSKYRTIQIYDYPHQQSTCKNYSRNI